ncbi:hypothetical protein KM043_018411 [Ampulex compressa]|nr:hypothetical protein KM043_018411 [Ampulex compressa]
MVCLTVAFFHFILQSIVCAIKYDELQQVIKELEEYLKNMVQWKRQVLQCYVNRYAKFYAMVMIWFYFNSIVFIITPAVADGHEYPTDVKYPFSIHSLLPKIIIYGHQSLVLLQCSAQVSVKAFIALLILFSAARFVILTEESKSISTIFQLKRSVEEHQHLLEYTNSVIDIVRPLVLCSITACFISLVFNGITLLVPTSLEAKIEFLLLCGTALMEVYMLAWPADHLMNMSSEVAEGVYDTSWYSASMEMRKIVLSILMRSQKPITIAVAGILPPVSLQYYASFLSGAFSYFTTMKIMVDNNDKD